MNNLLFKTALKWVLVAFGIQVLFSIPGIVFGLNTGVDAAQIVNIFLAIINILVSIAIYTIACLEFSNKRNHLASTGELFGLVGLIYGMNTVISLIWTFVSFKFFVTMPAEYDEIMQTEKTQMAMLTMGLVSTVFLGLVAALAGITLAGIWRTFQKAGRGGWEILVPIYNRVVMCEIGKKPLWWVIMLFIPLVNIVFSIMIINGISNAFGKDAGWTVGLIFLPFIFYPLLAWDGARYQFGDFETPGGPSVEDHLVV